MATKKQDSESERRKELARNMAMLAVVYDKRFSDEGKEIWIESYWRALGHMPVSQMRVAFERAVAEEQFCPSPATVKKHAKHAIPVEAAERTKEKPYTPPTPEQWAEIQRDLAAFKRTWDRNTRLVHGVRE